MAEASPSVKTEENTPKAAKDKNCPYCGQAFTSSSLGRHLDLYIKERNPKKPDGIHDVEEIRRLRGGVTRRQPKGSSRRRYTSTPAGTPAVLSRKEDVSDDESSAAPSPSARDARTSAGTSAAEIASMFPLGGVRWETTGVMNEAMVTSPDGSNGGNAGAGGEEARSIADLDMRGFNPNRRATSSRVVSRQAVKAQIDSKQKMQDALDEARAAELALREFANAWRAAKEQIELGSMPFDFDPLTLNFPALTLQCLRAQPTLFASTQLPTPSSWSTSPPGAMQFEALKIFFKEEFRKWRVKCAAATTALYEELKYPPQPNFQQIDRRQAIERAEKTADALEQEASKHLEIAFVAWNELPQERQTELWVLELARGIATKQAEIDKLKEAQSGLRQEATSLKNQIEQLNRLQQPREFKLVPPAHIPMSERVIFELQDSAVSHGRRGIGLNIDDRHSDLSTFVATAISRWKNVIVSTRSSSSGMGSQRPLDAPTAISSVTSPVGSRSNQTSSLPLATPTTLSLSSPKQTRRHLRASPQPPALTATENSSTRAAPVEMVSQPLPPPSTRAPELLASERRQGQNDDEDAEEEDEEEEEAEEGEEGEEGEEAEEGEENSGNETPAAQLARPSTALGAAGGKAGGQDADDIGDDDDEDEMSDKDADAEMEDGDEFAHMHTPISRGMSLTAVGSSISQYLPTQLKVPRTRATAQRPPPSSAGGPNGMINTSRSMPNISQSIHGHTAGQNMARPADMGLPMPTLGGDAMYMD